MQRCQAQPRTFAIAAFKPACASEIASPTPTRPPLDETAEEVGPERFGLGLADIDRQDLPPAALVDTMRDDQRFGDDAAAIADLLHLRVEEQMRVAALQRPRPECLDVLVELLADAADVDFEIRSPSRSKPRAQSPSRKTAYPACVLPKAPVPVDRT